MKFKKQEFAWGVLNGMIGQLIQRKKAIRGTDVSLNIFSEWFQACSNESNERTYAQNNLRHKGTKARKIYRGKYAHMHVKNEETQARRHVVTQGMQGYRHVVI